VLIYSDDTVLQRRKVSVSQIWENVISLLQTWNGAKMIQPDKANLKMGIF
jgi:hypothetical protein